MRMVSVPVGRSLVMAKDSGGSGIPILCLHGNSLSAESYAGLASELSDEYRVIQVDFLGHGRSQWPSNVVHEYTFAGCSALIGSVAEWLGLSDFVVVGHSLGGHAAIEAISGLVFLHALILISAPPFNSTVAPRVFRPDPTEGLLFKGTLNDIEIRMLADALVSRKGELGDQGHLTTHWVREVDPRFRPALGKSLGRGEFLDEVQILRRCSSPVLSIGGASDPFIDWEAVRAARLLDRPAVLVEGAGHSPHVEFPRVVANIVSGFLDQTGRVDV